MKKILLIIFLLLISIFSFSAENETQYITLSSNISKFFESGSFVKINTSYTVDIYNKRVQKLRTIFINKSAIFSIEIDRDGIRINTVNSHNFEYFSISDYIFYLDNHNDFIIDDKDLSNSTITYY